MAERFPWSCPPCPPEPPPPCPSVCPPPPPPPPCRVKPPMKHLLRRQIATNIMRALTLGLCAGISYHFLVGRPRIAKYAEYYRKTDCVDLANEMAKKGLFQGVVFDKKYKAS